MNMDNRGKCVDSQWQQADHEGQAGEAVAAQWLMEGRREVAGVHQLTMEDMREGIGEQTRTMESRKRQGQQANYSGQARGVVSAQQTTQGTQDGQW